MTYSGCEFGVAIKATPEELQMFMARKSASFITYQIAKNKAEFKPMVITACDTFLSVAENDYVRQDQLIKQAKDYLIETFGKDVAIYASLLDFFEIFELEYGAFNDPDSKMKYVKWVIEGIQEGILFVDTKVILTEKAAK